MPLQASDVYSIVIFYSGGGRRFWDSFIAVGEDGGYFENSQTFNDGISDLGINTEDPNTQVIYQAYLLGIPLTYKLGSGRDTKRYAETATKFAIYRATFADDAAYQSALASDPANTLRQPHRWMVDVNPFYQLSNPEDSGGGGVTGTSGSSVSVQSITNVWWIRSESIPDVSPSTFIRGDNGFEGLDSGGWILDPAQLSGAGDDYAEVSTSQRIDGIWTQTEWRLFNVGLTAQFNTVATEFGAHNERVNSDRYTRFRLATGQFSAWLSLTPEYLDWQQLSYWFFSPYEGNIFQTSDVLDFDPRGYTDYLFNFQQILGWAEADQNTVIWGAQARISRHLIRPIAEGVGNTPGKTLQLSFLTQGHGGAVLLKEGTALTTGNTSIQQYRINFMGASDNIDRINLVDAAPLGVIAKLRIFAR